MYMTSTHKSVLFSSVFVGFNMLSFTVGSNAYSAFKQDIKKPCSPPEFYKDQTCPMQSVLTSKALHQCHLVKRDFYVSVL